MDEARVLQQLVLHDDALDLSTRLVKKFAVRCQQLHAKLCFSAWRWATHDGIRYEDQGCVIALHTRHLLSSEHAANMACSHAALRHWHIAARRRAMLNHAVLALHTRRRLLRVLRAWKAAVSGTTAHTRWHDKRQLVQCFDAWHTLAMQRMQQYVD